MHADTPLMQPDSWLLGSADALRNDQLATYERAMLDHGDLVRFRVGPPKVGFEFDAVFHPDGAREILASRAGDFVKDAPAFTEVARLIGNGLLTSEGDQWRRDRRLVAPLFTPRQIASYVEPTTEVAAAYAESWRASAATDDVFDLEATAMDYALAVLGRTVFGADIVEAGPVLRATLPVVFDYAIQRGLAPVRTPTWLATPANRRAQRARRDLYRLVDDIIAHRRATGGGRPDLLNLLLEARDPDTGVGLDDREVRDQVLIFLVAGHETTGATLAFTLHLLGRYPAIQDRVRSEVTAAVGTELVELDDVKQLTYTQQVINESLRLYPPGHTLVRRARVDTEVLGRPVPAKRIVAVSVWGIHHHPEIWPEPHRFDPDRFATGDHSRYSHLPFGGGPRSCIANELAVAELVIAVATTVVNFELRSLLAEPELDVAITIRPKAPLPCRFVPIGDRPRYRD